MKKNDFISTTTIEDVRKMIAQSYEGSHLLTKIMFKSWSRHSESRHANGNTPFSFTNYSRHIHESALLEQVNLGIIECDDIGGVDEVKSFLMQRIVW